MNEMHLMVEILHGNHIFSVLFCLTFSDYLIEHSIIKLSEMNEKYSA